MSRIANCKLGLKVLVLSQEDAEQNRWSESAVSVVCR